MIEVKYPFSHGLDGKIHQIIINKIYNCNDHIILFGNDRKKEVIIELIYSSKIYEWVMLPRLSYDIISILNSAKKENITDILKKELEGKIITNTEELNYQKTNSDILSVNNQNIILKDHNLPNHYYLEEIIKSKNALELKHKPKDKLQDIMEIFLINKKKAYTLISDFLDQNNECKNIKYAKKTMILLKELFDVLVQISDVLFTEDDLIDLGLIINKLHFKKTEKINQREFNELINEGKKLINTLKNRISKKKK